MTQWIAEWDIIVKISGYTTMGYDIYRRTDDYSGNAIFFQGPGRQTDSLMTDRSQGHQNRDIYLILVAGSHNLRCVFG